MSKYFFPGIAILLILAAGVYQWQRVSGRNHGELTPGPNGAPPVMRIVRPSVTTTIPTTEDGWRQILSPEQYHVLREAGTERPFSSPLDFETRPGTYVSADCGEPLFRSEQKYDSGTGWPSFWAPIDKDAVVLKTDNSLPFAPRTEVLSRCGGHLGHVFDDGPEPTGKRYCMNGLALIFVPDPATSTPR